jgi:hypothetical protein
MTRRLTLLIKDWPTPWRAAWEQAIKPRESLFEDVADFSALRPGTLDIREEAVGVYLGFLRRHGLPDPMLPSPAGREGWHIDAFIAEQRARGVANSTLHIRMQALTHALRMMWPTVDFTWLQRPGGKSLRRALPYRPRKIEVRDNRELLQRALDLHAEGLTGKGYAEGKIALRDAAVMALLAWHGTRARALTGMRIDSSISLRHDRYWVAFDVDDTKMHHRYEIPLPVALTRVFDDYLHSARPHLGGLTSNALWMSISREPLTQRGVTEIARSRTLQWFGVERGPHWFRKCITTTVRLVAPELALEAAIVMDHSLAVAQEHYNMAKGVAAAQRHEERINRRIAQTHGRADEFFRRSLPANEYLALRRIPPGEW